MSPGGSGNAPRPHLEGALWSGYHSPQVEVAVRLNTNEAPEPPPPEFVAALAAAVGEVALNRYPDRRATRLREAIAELHGLGADQVFCANGSNEVIQSLLLAYGGPGRSCALFEPTYALHSHIARLTSTRVVEGERGPDYLIEPAEVDRVLAAAAATASGDGEPAVVFLCSPNNPTGLVEPDETVEAVLARAPGIVVVDEAYIQFARRSAVALLAGHDNLVVLRTYSKTWALAGLRLGYALGAPAIIEALFSAALPYHVDAVKQAAGTIALQFTAAMDGRVARLVAERARVLAGLAALGLAATPSESNFILFSTGDRDAHEVWEGLVARSVLVRDLSGWPRLAGHLRVTIGTGAENDAFLAALADVIG
ncbi:MAG: histidinol-phosphate transaminase [Acidimicrobiales bacterium]